MKYYLQVLKNYAEFNGRARRKEYWQFSLFHILIIILLVIPLMISMPDTQTSGPSPLIIIAATLLGIYILGTFLPSLAVTVRRLHDINKSGWYYLTSFIPYAGGIIILVLTAKNGDPGSNKYGSDPKGGNIDIDNFGIEEEFED